MKQFDRLNGTFLVAVVGSSDLTGIEETVPENYSRNCATPVSLAILNFHFFMVNLFHAGLQLDIFSASFR